MRRILSTLVLICASSIPTVAGLQLDPPGRPNEDGHTINGKLSRDDFPLEERFAYFAHYSPTVRSTAAASMRKVGEKAMPFIIRGLQSDDRHVVRTSCDAISNVRSYSGVKLHDTSPITPELAATALPQLLALLDRDDFYLQAGALQALSRCGKASAPHLQQIASFLADEEWWLRASSAAVLQSVGSPEADPYSVDLARAMLREQHIMCLNSMTQALRALMQTSTNVGEVVVAIGEGLANMEPNTLRRQGLQVLESVGTNAVIARPHIEALVSEERARLEQAEGAAADVLKKDLGNLEHTLKIISGQP
jgi:hypothetical protein